MRGIDQALVNEVWREITSYPPGRIDEEARDFLARQPEVAAFAHTVTAEQDPVVQRAGLGLCFLLFKILERSLGHPFPRLEESRLRAAHDASTEWLAGLEGDDSARIVAAAGAPGHPTLAAHLVTVFYGEGAEGCDERVRAGFLLMLRTLTDALDLGPVEA
ncbi:MAG TPA: hypothetical protein VNQ72_10085 [Candidatus Dormibacteraeota bacterium]|nr:hypothetical protein [Methylomirabilota bacterium]HWN03354.1 hypothetical protein [Candidatus Dormibacteraeota bacterium]